MQEDLFWLLILQGSVRHDEESELESKVSHGMAAKNHGGT